MKINMYTIAAIILILLSLYCAMTYSEGWPLIYFISAIVVFISGGIINAINNKNSIK